MDPEKYTTPPHLRQTRDELEEDEDDYVKQDRAGGNDKENFTLDQTKASDDYVGVDLPDSKRPTGSSKDSDYVDVDDLSLSKDAKPIVPSKSSDYVDVDDQSISKRKSKTESDSDYVKV